MTVYVYVLGDIANGEAGINGSRSSPCQMSHKMAKQGGPIYMSRFILVLL
jgi:hypothetical protein